MTTRRTFAIIALAAALLVGCAPDAPYRLGLRSAGGKDCGATPGTAFESLCYALGDRNKTPVDYFLGFVEFDDQGWFHDPAQLQNIFQSLSEDHRATGNQYLIVVYAHGWKHNAALDDADVGHFQNLLERLVLMERASFAAAQRSEKKEKTGARKVVGIYLGWRGASLTLPVLQNLTFWERKHAAERVGERSVKQALVDINQFKKRLNRCGTAAECDGDDRPASANDTQLILMGHSFGGLVMYQALHTELLERARHIRKPSASEYGYDLAKSFGDFVLLINPAFEGAAYEALFEAAHSRCYASEQRPVMAIATSEGDWATGTVFPIGRAYTIFQSAPRDGERDTVFRAVGHLDRYRTHRLTQEPGPEGEETQPTEPSPAEAQTALQAIIDSNNEDGPLLSPETKEKTYHRAKLTRYEKKQPDYLPYLVIQSDTNMIKDHNDIWNDNFIKFTRSLIVSEVMKEPGTGRPMTCRPFEKLPK